MMEWEKEIKRAKEKVDKAKERLKYYEDVLFCLKVSEAKLTEVENG